MTKRTGRCAILVVAALSLPKIYGQQVDRSLLAAKYGPPAEEVFDIRRDLTLALLYSENGRVCKMELRPARNTSSVIPATLVQELVDEVLPPSIRGTPKREFGSITGAESFSKWAEYEGGTISQTGSDTRPTPQGRPLNPLAVIQHKTCRSSTELQTTNAACRSALFNQSGGSGVQGTCGQPVEDVYNMRPGITLAVIYGNTQQACRMDIRLARDASPVRVSLIEQLVDELVPLVLRGTLKNEGMTCNGACWITTDYENVHIEHDGGNPMADEGSGSVTPNSEAEQTVLATIQMKSCEVSR